MQDFKHLVAVLCTYLKLLIFQEVSVEEGNLLVIVTCTKSKDFSQYMMVLKTGCSEQD